MGTGSLVWAAVHFAAPWVGRFAEAAMPVLLGVFVGGFLTYRRQVYLERKAERRRNASDSRRAQFALVAQRSSLRDTIRDQKLLKYVEGEISWFSVMPILDFAEPPPLDVESLSFLLPSNADLVYDLHVVHSQFRVAVGLNEFRNGVSVQFQQRLADPQLQDKTMREAIPMIGAPLVPVLKNMTDSLAFAVGRALSENTRVYDRLLAALKQEFEGEKETLLGCKDHENAEVAAFLKAWNEKYADRIAERDLSDRGHG